MYLQHDLEMSKETVKETIEIVKETVNILNVNNEILKEIAPDIITAETTLLMSVFNARESSAKQTIIQREIRESIRRNAENIGFKIVPERYIDGKLFRLTIMPYKIGKRFKNVENYLFKRLLNSVCYGQIAEGDILDLVEIENDTFKTPKDIKDKVFYKLNSAKQRQKTELQITLNEIESKSDK